MTRLINVFVLHTLALAISGVVQAAELIPMKYNPSNSEYPPTVYAGGCPITLVQVRDERQNKQTIGASPGSPLLVGSASDWASDALNSLDRFGYKVQQVSSRQTPENGILLDPAITRAYTWQIGLKIFSMVVIKADFYDRNGLLQSKTYRANGDKANMWGADAEFVATLDYGINNLLPVMARDLVELCKGNTVSRRSYSGVKNPDSVNGVQASNPQ
jgi:hypothetical protein